MLYQSFTKSKNAPCRGSGQFKVLLKVLSCGVSRGRSPGVVSGGSWSLGWSGGGGGGVAGVRIEDWGKRSGPAWRRGKHSGRNPHFRVLCSSSWVFSCGIVVVSEGPTPPKMRPIFSRSFWLSPGVFPWKRGGARRHCTAEVRVWTFGVWLSSAPVGPRQATLRRRISRGSLAAVVAVGEHPHCFICNQYRSLSPLRVSEKVTKRIERLNSKCLKQHKTSQKKYILLKHFQVNRQF